MLQIGCDGVDISRTPVDDAGHGTHTASTAAGNFIENTPPLALAGTAEQGPRPGQRASMWRGEAGTHPHPWASWWSLDTGVRHGLP